MVFRVEIDDRNAHAVLYLAFAEIVQMLLPVAVLLQIFGHVFRYQDVTSITTIHYPLGDVDAGTCNIGATTYVNHTANRAAMNSHPQLQLGMFSCRGADLQGAFQWRRRGVIKHQRHAIPGWHAKEAVLGLG